MLENKTVLVTGGTGSFGHFIIPKLLERGVKEIRVFSRDEEKQLDMGREFTDERLKFIIGNIRDYDRLHEATKGIQILYHAAALKIITFCERNPLEALKTNVLGSWNVKNASIASGIEKAIFISTDKAVKPVNLYGMTKAVGEKIWINDEFKDETEFAVLRYGNIIGSRGSVIPFFKKLVEEGKPLPITHPKMTRFLITPDQAAKLVFKTTELRMDKKIYVPILPACQVSDLAIVIAGEDYPTKIVGIRPGEKIHECLIQEDELRRAERVEDGYIIHPYGEYSSGIEMGELNSNNITAQMSRAEIAQLLEEGDSL